MSLEDTHVNILFSKSLEGLIDKDMILNRHIVPPLASRDKNTIYAKVSAAMLNGYASIVDNIAEKRGIKLKSSIGNSGVIASSPPENFYVFCCVYRVNFIFICHF